MCKNRTDEERVGYKIPEALARELYQHALEASLAGIARGDINPAINSAIAMYVADGRDFEAWVEASRKQWDRTVEIIRLSEESWLEEQALIISGAESAD